jgi:hypothetical protein
MKSTHYTRSTHQSTIQNKLVDVSWPGLIRESLVDFIAILLPGFAFSMALFASVGIPLYHLLAAMGEFENLKMETVEIYKAILSNFGTELFLTLLAFSYIVGHVFYRSDIQLPDAKSSYLDGLKGLDGAVWRQQPIKGIAQGTSGYVDYPYPKLDEYLKQRNLRHLLGLVYWTSGKAENYSNSQTRKKSKGYINLLKTRVSYYKPQYSQMLTRMEAHIRLVASSWYASRAVTTASLIGCMLGLLANLVQILRFCHARGLTESFSDFFKVNSYKRDQGGLLTKCLEVIDKDVNISFISRPSALLIPLALLILSVLIKKRVETFLHYQRLRELIHLFELVHLIALEQPRILWDLPRRGKADEGNTAPKN